MEYDIFKTEYDVLIADDEPSFRLMMSATFKSAGFSIDTAEDGYDALKKFLTHRYRLIIMDLRMPFMDGLEATKAIKKINRVQPVVVVSAYDDGCGQEVLGAGAYTFLAKPVDMDKLIGIAQKIVGKSVSRR